MPASSSELLNQGFGWRGEEARFQIKNKTKQTISFKWEYSFFFLKPFFQEKHHYYYFLYVLAMFL